MPTVESTYEVIGQTVKIQLHGSEAVHMNKATLKLVIENIERSRQSYANDEAYQRALSLYQGALRLLENNGES